MTVDGRWATTNAVVPASTRRSASSTCASVCTSSADNGSSSTSTRGRASTARARGAPRGGGGPQPLALPAGERESLLADAGVEAEREVIDELGLGDADRL